MSSIVNIPFKTDSSCSVVYLIDENLCLKDSLEIYNHNIQALSASLLTLEGHANRWNQIYSTFIASSGNWLTTASDILQYSSKWNSTFSTVSSLSANWTKPFSVYFPEVLDYSLWYGANSTQGVGFADVYKNKILLDWLNKNFPPQKYLNGLIINLFVHLNYAKPFNYNFKKLFYEPCSASGGKSVECTQAPMNLSRGCNHHGGRAGYRACDNAFSYCTRGNYNVRPFQVNCKGYSEKPDSGSKDLPPYGKTLIISHNFSSTDTSIVRVLSVNYKNDLASNSWKFIN